MHISGFSSEPQTGFALGQSSIILLEPHAFEVFPTHWPTMASRERLCSLLSLAQAWSSNRVARKISNIRSVSIENVSKVGLNIDVSSVTKKYLNTFIAIGGRVERDGFLLGTLFLPVGIGLVYEEHNLHEALKLFSLQFPFESDWHCFWILTAHTFQALGICCIHHKISAKRLQSCTVKIF